MLADKAILVYVSVSKWIGRKKDKTATTDAETKYNTEKKAVNVTKNLLPGAAELAKVISIEGQIRELVYDNTHPWLGDGARILSSKNYIDFMRRFAGKKLEFFTAVDEFLAVYPRLRDEARLKLGSLYRDADYPPIEKLRGNFQCEVSVMPLPSVGDFRTEVTESERKAFLDKMSEVETRATTECFERLAEVVRTAAARLSEPKAMFKDSLIDNIADLCGLLPKLNVTDDSRLEAIRAEVEAIVGKISPTDCRKNSIYRQAAAADLSKIDRKLDAFFGASTETDSATDAESVPTEKLN